MAARNGPTSATPLLHAQIAGSSANRQLSPNPQSRAFLPRSSSTSPGGRPGPSRLRRKRHRPSTPQSLWALLTLFALAGFAFVAWDVSSLGGCYFRPVCRLLGVRGRGEGDEWWRASGQYAPWRAWDTAGGRKNLPRGCEVDQVNILHRHTARYPTRGAASQMRTALDKLKRRKVDVPRRHPELAFLADADLEMTGWQLEALTDQGRKAAWRSGKEHKALYRSVSVQGGVFSRSSGVDRVVEAGQYWLDGFNDEPFKIQSRKQLPQIDVVIPSAETSNNTLSVNTCPAFSNHSTVDVRHKLAKLMKPALERLNTLLQPQPALTMGDLVVLADMCPYDSQIEGEEWAGWSKWCGIFTGREWEVLGYMREVTRYYSVGQGSKLGKTMGAGWINELIARLTDTAPEDSTSTNRTLDADERTFPRGGKRVFADFSHDNEMIEIMTALNIYPQHRALQTDSMPQKRGYLLSRLIPFGSRLVVERIACDLNEWEPDPNAGEGGSDPGRDRDDKRDYVRILLNGKVLQVEHVACQQSGFFEHGMCDVEDFVDSQAWSTEEVDWSICYE